MIRVRLSPAVQRFRPPLHVGELRGDSIELDRDPLGCSALPEGFRHDGLDLALDQLVGRFPPALAPVLSLEPGLPVEGPNAAILDLF